MPNGTCMLTVIVSDYVGKARFFNAHSLCLLMKNNLAYRNAKCHMQLTVKVSNYVGTARFLMLIHFVFLGKRPRLFLPNFPYG